MNLKLMLLLIVSSLMVIFIAQNTAVVEISFLFWRVSISSALLLFFTLLTGFALGWAIDSYLLYRRRKNK